MSSSAESQEQNGCSGYIFYGILFLLIFVGIQRFGYTGAFNSAADFTGKWTSSENKTNNIRSDVFGDSYRTQYELYLQDGYYKLYYGSVGHLKLKRSGKFEKVTGGFLFHNFDLGNKSGHTITEINDDSDGDITSFCTRSVESSLSGGCDIRFAKVY